MNNLYSIIAAASNIKDGENPPYTREDFLLAYPQFGISSEGVENVPVIMIDAYINIAQASVKKARFHTLWWVCMGLFIAHFLTLYLQSLSSPDDGIQGIINSGLSKGLQSSKSAGSLSVSYDYSVLNSDFEGWKTFKQTTFGQQYMTFARITSMGGMYVR